MSSKKPLVFTIIFYTIVVISIVIIGLTLSQITNKYKSGQSYGDIDITKSFVDSICEYSNAVPYTQVALFYNKDDGAFEVGYLECSWRIRNSVLRVVVHFASVVVCLFSTLFLKKQNFKNFLIATYGLTLIGVVGVYSSIIDVISVKRAYDYCMESSNFFEYDCQYKNFNATVIMNFICSVTIFILSVISSKLRYQLVPINNNNSDNSNNNNNIDLESRQAQQPQPVSIPEQVQKEIKLKPSKSKKEKNNLRDESILEEEIDFENNGTILTTNDQYLTTNDDRSL